MKLINLPFYENNLWTPECETTLDSLSSPSASLVLVRPQTLVSSVLGSTLSSVEVSRLPLDDYGVVNQVRTLRGTLCILTGSNQSVETSLPLYFKDKRN